MIKVTFNGLFIIETCVTIQDVIGRLDCMEIMKKSFIEIQFTVCVHYQVVHCSCMYLFNIYLFKLHITPIWVKQLQYKSMQTYKKQKTKKHTQT